MTDEVGAEVVTSGSAAVHIAPEDRADYQAPIMPIDFAAVRKGEREKAFGHAIRQMKGVIDGTIENLYLDQTTKLVSPEKHRLDEVGGVDGMRIVFRGQVEELVRTMPKRGARMTLDKRLRSALKLCDEHLARSAAFGQQLSERTAAAACQECVYFLSALHLVLQPLTDRLREDVERAYWERRDPVGAMPATWHGPSAAMAEVHGNRFD
jgi:hypothetical protein